MNKEERLKAAQATWNRYENQKALCYRNSEVDRIAIERFIAGAEAEAESKWISVNVVLPEKGVKVRCKLPKECGGERILYRMKHNGKWNDYNVYVSHWQPLPQPPLNQQ